eukprot:scaffold217302_cov31-Attheya_sp.AAC.3
MSFSEHEHIRRNTYQNGSNVIIEPFDSSLNSDAEPTIVKDSIMTQKLLDAVVYYINERRICLRHGWQVHAYHAHSLCGAERYAQYLLAPRVFMASWFLAGSGLLVVFYLSRVVYFWG